MIEPPRHSVFLPDRSDGRRFSRRGGALVMVLLVVSMLAILTLAYFSTMQIEQRAAHAFAHTQEVKMVAQGTVSHGIDILRTAIPEPSMIHESAAGTPARNWAVNPGRITLFDDSGSIVYVPLHTGVAESDPNDTIDPDVSSVDLNEPIPGREFPPIVMSEGDRAGSNAEIPPMRVKWVPVLRNPGEPADSDNPISSRYAFWIDDESARINFNVALGKPSRGKVDTERFYEQYALGMMPPLFTGGAGDVEFNAKSQDREWGLGQPRSINLDVLFDDRKDLLEEKLLAHAWLRGFSRYPESILEFVDMPERDRQEWYHRNKFHLTFYSRAPEFNAFGRSRFFTTNYPLSLEAGPLYQLPFVYNGPDVKDPDYEISGVLHLNSLLGSLGFTHEFEDEEKGKVHAANVVNRAQLEMLMRYFSREWPGYGKSFIGKYGEAECYQIALNMLTMARMATTTMRAKMEINSTRDLGLRSTSVLYSPHATERPKANPERHYWEVDLEPPGAGPAETIPMLPQTPGPHITEVRLHFKSFPAPGGSPTKRQIGVRYEVEYFMHGLGPVAYLNALPMRVDYFKVEMGGGIPGVPAIYELGPPNREAGEGRPDRNWNYNPSKNRVDDETGEVLFNRNGKPKRLVDRRSLGSLSAVAGNKVRIASDFHPNKVVQNRVLVSSPWRYLGKRSRFLANPEDNQPDISDEAAEIDIRKNPRISFKVNWRLGMTVSSDSRRPRQMIPLGEDEEDTLQATFSLDLRTGDRETVSWQINDPRLSSHKEEWIIDTEGGGTPGSPNAIGGTLLEPERTASERSKFRYFQRGPGSARDPEKSAGKTFGLNRPDEYNSRSRVSSKGYWSVLHTGIQSREPWRTLNLGGRLESGDPPDSLLLNLLGATYPMQHDQWKINSTLPDEFSTVSFMNSTAGQINLNSRIYPESNEWFRPPPRTKPLEAVFAHLRPDAEIDQFVSGIKAYQEYDFFRYIGELSKVEGYQRSTPGATEFENEEFLRNMAGCLTTQSNTFGLWGAAQVVRKIPGHTEWGEFEDGDQVLAEKRFYALIERYIWPGRDGRPGNAHADSMGRWDRLARQNQSTSGWDGTTTDTLFQLPGSPPLRKGGGNRLTLDPNGMYPWFDGPQEVEMDEYASRALGSVRWTSSSLEEAYNPPQPAIKYRVIYFKFLDE